MERAKDGDGHPAITMTGAGRQETGGRSTGTGEKDEMETRAPRRERRPEDGTSWSRGGGSGWMTGELVCGFGGKVPGRVSGAAGGGERLRGPQRLSRGREIVPRAPPTGR